MKFLKLIGLVFIFVGMVYAKGNEMRIIAHRGASGYAPENSNEAFEKAIEFGSWAIEFDIRQCKSGELVIAHDSDLKRISNIEGLICDKTFDELKNLTLRDGGKIITVKDALDLINGRAAVILDIKEEGVAQKLAEIIKNCIGNGNWTTKQFFATGFEHRELKRIKEFFFNIKLMPSIIGTFSDLSAFAKRMDAYGICMIDLCFSDPVFKDAKSKGLEVWAWFADERGENVKKFMQLGFDAIMVDFPDKAKTIIEQNLSKESLNFYTPTTEQNARMNFVKKFWS